MTDTLDIPTLINTFSRRVSEARGLTDLMPEVLAIEEDETETLLIGRLTTAMMSMLTDVQLLELRAIDTTTHDPTETLAYLYRTVPEADTLITEEIELLFNELTADLTATR